MIKIDGKCLIYIYILIMGVNEEYVNASSVQTVKPPTRTVEPLTNEIVVKITKQCIYRSVGCLVLIILILVIIIVILVFRLNMG